MPRRFLKHHKIIARTPFFLVRFRISLTRPTKKFDIAVTRPHVWALSRGESILATSLFTVGFTFIHCFVFKSQMPDFMVSIFTHVL